MNSTTIAIILCLAVVPALTINCTPKGRLGYRLRKLMAANDHNNNSIAEGSEVKAEIDTNYDINDDQCTSRAEWVYRWLTYFRFSFGFAQARLEDVVKPPRDEKCLLTLSNAFGDENTKMPMQKFIGENLQTLIDFCEFDTKRYDYNCDCYQLPKMCEKDPYFSKLYPCVAYNKDE